MERSTFCNYLPLVLGIFVVTGCGEGHPPTYPVTGQVVFEDGSTLDYGGRVIFVNTSVTPPLQADAIFGPDGKFELSTFYEGDGAAAGHYKVAVFPVLPEDHEDKLVSDRDYAKAMQPIDDRFQDPGSSGLEFDVAAESAPHDFRVEVAEPRRRR